MILNFDESGNMGNSGRYFVIACVAGHELKPLVNVMNKAIINVKKQFKQYANLDEIKASKASPVVKEYILRKIASKDIQIRYIVADLHHIKPQLLSDQNTLYNYLLSFIIRPVASTAFVRGLQLNLDKRSIKVGSENSFEDYLKIKVRYEDQNLIPITVKYIESQNSVLIQAADFVANAIYSKYEYGNDYFYDIIDPKIYRLERFPYAQFGKDKVVGGSR
ncbi:uncharacterized protein DUF3800 [Paenibacillus cellulosilyticus]|uniref:Uncharacterized protein DUF3800 n=1 Tax=Paenibacillus cellulosilyticus TaxID=375489 RepID=A0A2V2YV53_9BACL|nr:DUF3800 domain-containing protein [Paenibacillus cellulosilyticus]PWW01240.1 uncharacterized protein DUF3800 [Paenibacillus cellulosilyticus]